MTENLLKQLEELVGSDYFEDDSEDIIRQLIAEGAGFEESEYWYDHLEKHIGWESLGKILCGYVTQPGDTKGKPELEKAYELGKSIH